jgi:hypothetical protein
MKVLIGGQQYRHAKFHHLLERVFTGGGGNVRVYPVDGLPQPKRQHHFPVAGALDVGAVMRNIWPIEGPQPDGSGKKWEQTSFTGGRTWRLAVSHRDRS